jgi:hypothetical protein
VYVVNGVGTFQEVELEDHEDDGDDHNMIKCSLGKEEREKQNGCKAKV